MESMREALEAAGIENAAVEGTRAGGEKGGTNVSEVERWASAIGGGALAIYGVTRGSLGGLVLALVGGTFIYRGASGHCHMYEALGIDTAGSSSHNPFVSVRGERGIKVEKSIVIRKSPQELYKLWRNFENLPRFMSHLVSVEPAGENRWHWTAKAFAGTTLEWDAEVYRDHEDELIAWRSLEGSQVDNAGSVRFEHAPNGGTEVKISIKYDPPGGALGRLVAKIFGEDPAHQIEHDLRRLKEQLEG